MLANISVCKVLFVAVSVCTVCEVHHLSYFTSTYWLFQLLDVDPQDDAEEGANVDLDSQRKGKCAVIKTSTRQVRHL